MHLKKNNLGYTLVEIVTTTAIVGTLTAVAVPNFLRVKMNVNMEMVKQHMKVIGQEMNELYNQNNPHRFPASLEEIMSGKSPEELSITASLNAIESKGIGLNYVANPVRGIPVDYTLRAERLPGTWEVPEEPCLIVDSSARVREISCSSVEGLFYTRAIDASLINQEIFKTILSDHTIDQIKILSGMLIQFGLFMEYIYPKISDSPLTVQIPDDPNCAGRGCLSTEVPALPSFLNNVYPENEEAFGKVAKKASLFLKEKYGIHVYINHDSPKPGALPDGDLSNMFYGGVQIAVKFDSKPDPLAFSTAETRAYKNYVEGIPVFQEHYKSGDYPGVHFGTFDVSQEGNYTDDPSMNPNVQI